MRRPPHPDPPPPDGNPELIQRYREVKAEFPVVDLPPLATAYWLIKPPTLVRGTWNEPEEAARWLGERLVEYAPRFASSWLRDSTRLAILVNSAAERLGWGGDVAHGCYLERPSFLSLALVTCSPNRAAPDLACPGRAHANGPRQWPGAADPRAPDYGRFRAITIRWTWFVPS